MPAHHIGLKGLFLLALCACTTNPRQHEAIQAEPIVGGHAQSPSMALGEIVPQLDPAIWRVHHAKNGDYWFGSRERGLYRYDGKTLTRYPVQAGGKQIQIFSISLDRRGVPWLGTQANGVYRFNGKEFEAF